MKNLVTTLTLSVFSVHGECALTFHLASFEQPNIPSNSFLSENKFDGVLIDNSLLSEKITSDKIDEPKGNSNRLNFTVNDQYPTTLSLTTRSPRTSLMHCFEVNTSEKQEQNSDLFFGS